MEAGSATRISEAEQERAGNDEVVDEALAPLRALDAALSKRTIVKTSMVRLDDYDATRAHVRSVVDADGSVIVTDQSTRQFLEKSVSDVISMHESRRGWRESSASRLSAETPGLGEEQAIGSRSAAANPSSQQAAGGGGGSGEAGSFYSIPSCSSNFEGPVSAEAMQRAERVIADLEANGPAGLVHLSSLSATIGKPIRVWISTGAEKGRMVGRSRVGTGEPPVDIEYHEPAAAAAASGPEEAAVGHWTLRNNEEPAARDGRAELNDCLFDAVADQVDCLAPELRRRTIERMRAHVRSLANRIEAIAEEEKCDRIALLVGGARYGGRGPQDAKRVIDASQQGGYHPDGKAGHPRGHASEPGANGPTESVENYSRGGRKTGFLCRQAQDATGHLVLESDKAQDAMRQLNAGADSVVVRLSASDLEPGSLPEAAEYLDGRQQGPAKSLKQLVIVLRHHANQKNNSDADVFVHTFYPVLDN